MEQYHYLIRAHGVIAVIAFLFLLPSAIMMGRFYTKVPGRGVRVHIYLNILVLGLATVVFILGFVAVGPSRSLTNPHHGIGVAIYVLLLWQTLAGNWIRKKFKKKMYRRPPLKLMLHQWIGRATAILGIVQVPLGLTLYGSPKWTFILYALWMGFLLLLYFVNQYKAYDVVDGGYRTSDVTIEGKKKKKSGGFGKFLAPLAAGAGAVLLAKQLGGKDGHDDDEVLPSRHGSRRNSESFIEDEKHDRKEGGGMFKKLLTGAAVAGAGIFAKKYFDKRHDHDEEYSAVAHDTPSRRPSRRHEPAYTDVSESTIEVRRADDRRGHNLLPAAAAAAISATDRPTTPRPTKSPRHPRRTSYDSYTSIASPSRREDDKGHTGRNALLAGLGLGWLGKKLKDRKDNAEQRRLDDIRRQELDDERRLESERRHGTHPPRYTGDGRPPANRRDDWTESDLSSDFTSVHPRPASGPMPPLSAAAPIVSSSSRHDVVAPLPMPAGPPRDSYQEYLDDSHVSRRHSSRGRRDAEAAAAVAGAALAASEADRHRRHERSQSAGGDRRSGSRPAAAVKVRVGSQDVTLQRLTREERAEREARRRRRHSLSDSEVSAGPSGRYRRDESLAERRAERRAESEVEGLRPLSPPRPAFAGGKAKDSAYYSAGSPGQPPGSAGSVVSPPESRGTWSAMSPGGTGLGAEDAAERRRRRRAERAQRGDGGGSVGVEFS